MAIRDNSRALRYGLVGVWLLFTLALTGWWGYFASRQLYELARLDSEHALTLVRYQRMLIWEGGTLVFCLLGGGIALLYMTWRERRESRRIKEFFAAFTHELKTPLASIQLQAEVLEERLGEGAEKPKIDRLLADLGRLNLRLENSLFLAAEKDVRLLREAVRLSDILAPFEGGQILITVESDCTLNGDRRSLEVIAGNIVQNSLTHGRASELTVSATQTKPDSVVIRFKDNGVGFKGNSTSLGRLFSRPASDSGSGIGLYLVRTLSRKMGGTASFSGNGAGFEVRLELPGSMP